MATKALHFFTFHEHAAQTCLLTDFWGVSLASDEFVEAALLSCRLDHM